MDTRVSVQLLTPHRLSFHSKQTTVKYKVEALIAITECNASKDPNGLETPDLKCIQWMPYATQMFGAQADAR